MVWTLSRNEVPYSGTHQVQILNVYDILRIFKALWLPITVAYVHVLYLVCFNANVIIYANFTPLTYIILIFTPAFYHYRSIIHQLSVISILH